MERPAPIDLRLRALLYPDVEAADPHPARRILPALVAGGLFYGAVMGSFTGLESGRHLQLVYSAVKVPLLLLATFGVSLPSFFMLNTLAGLRGDFGRALTALLSAQAALTVILAALAPLTALWYCTSADYPSAVTANAILFGVASLSAQISLRRQYAPLIRGNPRHRWMLRGWIVIYAFVGIQMAWIGRPFIGDPTGPVRFLRPDAWGNAYVLVWNLLRRLIF